MTGGWPVYVTYSLPIAQTGRDVRAHVAFRNPRRHDLNEAFRAVHVGQAPHDDEGRHRQDRTGARNLMLGVAGSPLF